MPKQIVDDLVRSITRDIKAHFGAGERYYSLRELCLRFNAAYGTVQKAVGRCAQQGVLSVSQGSGIFAAGGTTAGSAKGKKVTALFQNHSGEFNAAFCRGLADILAPAESTVSAIINEYNNTAHLGFGDYLLGLGADGVVAVSFDNSALPFYHAMREGLDLIANVGLEELPQLPVVQSDNFGNAFAAGLKLSTMGYTDITIITGMSYNGTDFRGFFRERHLGFTTALSQHALSAETIHLVTPDSRLRLDKRLARFGPRSALFLLDISILDSVAEALVRKQVPVTAANCLLFDCCDLTFSYRGLPQLLPVGQSVRKIAQRCAQRLLSRWENGSFGDPMLEKI